jgi:hypothetical protein
VLAVDQETGHLGPVEPADAALHGPVEPPGRRKVDLRGI